MTSLAAFPDEIIRHILLFVSPEDNLGSVQLLSRRFYHLADEALLWKFHCRNSFTHWNHEHRLQEKLAARASSVEWKQLWVTRKRVNTKAARLLDGILATKVTQLKRLQQICQLGYDAKDFLLEQCHADETRDDVLARRYYANSALDSIHRGIAVEIWSKYQGNPLSTRGLDTALGAFDMFVLHDQPHDLDYISETLDSLARQIRGEVPHFETLTTRQKALCLVRWLRSKDLTGMEDERTNYRNLRNCLIGHALSEKGHQSLPIISSAIFCCVAERLGMTTSCCAFPSHVHATVFAPAGLTLDGEEEHNPDAELATMYVNPWESDDEVTLGDLRNRLNEFGWTQGAEAFLKAAPVPIIVQRLAQNIKTTWSTVQSLADSDPSEVEMKRLRTGHPDLNLEAAYYASMWADLMTKQASNFHWAHNLDAFLNRFALSWSEDAWMVEKYLIPLYDKFIEAYPHQRQRVGWENVRAILNMLENLDNRPPTVSRRYTQEIRTQVRYKIGQVFRHRRYQYVGIINGWAAKGTSDLPTPHYLTRDEADEEEGNGAQRVELLRRPPPKTYYTCLRPTVDRLRVAQDNIDIITDPSLIPDSLFFLAGKFFKRFDEDTCTFVSNLEEYYPDD